MGFQRGHLRPATPPARRAGVGHAGAAAALCGLLLTGAARVGAEAAPVATRATADRTVSLKISDADIHAVVSYLQSRTSLNVVVVEGAHPYKRVNLYLDHVSPDMALRYVAASAGATVTAGQDGVYVLSPVGSDGQAPVSQTAALSQSAPTYAPAPDAPRPVYSVHKIYLKNISPDDILRYFKLDRAENASADLTPASAYRGRGGLGGRNAQPYGQPYGGQGVNVLPLVNTVVQNGGGGYQQPSVPAGQGITGPNQANDYQSANRSVDPSDTMSQAHQFGFPGGGGFGGGGFGGGGFGGGGFPGGGFGGGGFPGGGFGGGGFPGGNQAGGFPGGAGGFPGGQNGQQRLALPDGVDRLYAVEGDNSLLLFSTVDGFNLVKEIVKNLDVKARQVQIKVEFVTAQVVDVDQFGLNLSLIPTPNLAGSFPTATNNPYTGGALAGVVNQTSNVLQYAYGNVAAQLYALLQRTRSKLVSAPLVSTTNNVTADVLFDQQIPFTTTNTTIVPNGGTVTTNTLSVQDIITDLPVTPRINADDTVTMTLTPVISTPAPGATGGGNNNGTGTGTGTGTTGTGTGTGTTGTGTGAGSGGTSNSGTNGGAVATNTQQIDVTRTVHSGETMVIGGLVSKTENYYQSKVPILGDLPLIGSLFRSRSKNNNDSELLIFVTPTIIDDDAQNGLTSAPQGDTGVNAVPGAQPNPGGQVTP